MDADTVAPKDGFEPENYQETDVFAWANNLVQYKDELKVELFFISKNYVLYKTALAEGLKKQLEPIFIDEMLEYILEGIDKGLIVRGFEDAEAEEHVLQRTQVHKVVLWSQTFLYGAHPTNPNFLSESHPLRFDRGDTFFGDKLEAEADALDFGKRGRGRIVTILRTAPIVGPSATARQSEKYGMPRFAFSEPSIGSSTTTAPSGDPIASTPSSSETSVKLSPLARRRATIAASTAASTAVVSSPPCPEPTTGSRAARP